MADGRSNPARRDARASGGQGLAWLRCVSGPVVRLALALTLALALGIAAAPAIGGPVATSSVVQPRPTTGFLSKPTDQIAVPGMLAGAEIAPEGDLYTGWAEYELRFGRRLARWNQPTRVLPNPSVPLLSSSLADGPVRWS